MTIKDEVLYFKNECRSYVYLHKLRESLEEELEELKSYGEPSSPGAKRVIYENAGDPYKDQNLSVIQRKTEVVTELNSINRRIDYINSIFDCISNYKINRIIFDLYVMNRNVRKVAAINGIEVSKMYRSINRELKYSILKYRENEKS